MIGFIKNLFSGILSFFVGLFGGKKSQQNQPSITSSADKLAEATASSADKLAKATAKTGSEIGSSFKDLVGGNKSQENNSSTKVAEKPAAANGKKRKRSGYFMELDEAEEVKSVNGAQPAKGAAAKTSEPVTAAKTAKAEPTKTQEPSAKAQTASAKVELVQTAEGVKAEPVKPEKAPAASTNGQNKTETTFAPKYLAPTSSNSRRRPGPNMNPFLDMARQVKNPG